MKLYIQNFPIFRFIVACFLGFFTPPTPGFISSLTKKMTRKICASVYLPCILVLLTFQVIGETRPVPAFSVVLKCPDKGFEKVDSSCRNPNYTHCILDEEQKNLVMGCIPLTWIETNKCPVYFKEDHRIDVRPCIGDDTQCPFNITLYKSFEAYKYPGCVKIRTTTTIAEATINPKESPDFPLYANVLIVVLIVVLIIVVLLIIFIVLCRKPISRKLKEYCAKQSEDAPVQNDEAELEEEAETMLSEPCENRSKSSKEMIDLNNQRKLNINVGIDQDNCDHTVPFPVEVEHRDNPDQDNYDHTVPFPVEVEHRDNPDQLNKDPDVDLPEQVERRDNPGLSDVTKTDIRQLWKKE